MLTPGFLWYFFKHHVTKTTLILGLTLTFICAPIMYSPKREKIKSMRTYKDGSVFIRTSDQWLQVDNKKIVVKGKNAFFVNENHIIGTRVVSATLLFMIFNLTFMGIRSGRLRKLWWQYNASNIKIVYDGINNDEYKILNNRILYRNGVDAPPHTEYPQYYDRIEIRMNTIKDIIK